MRSNLSWCNLWDLLSFPTLPFLPSLPSLRWGTGSGTWIRKIWIAFNIKTINVPSPLPVLLIGGPLVLGQDGLKHWALQGALDAESPSVKEVLQVIFLVNEIDQIWIRLIKLGSDFSDLGLTFELEIWKLYSLEGHLGQPRECLLHFRGLLQGIIVVKTKLVEPRSAEIKVFKGLLLLLYTIV